MDGGKDRSGVPLHLRALIPKGNVGKLFLTAGSRRWESGGEQFRSSLDRKLCSELGCLGCELCCELGSDLCCELLNVRFAKLRGATYLEEPQLALHVTAISLILESPPNCHHR
jgi:hypothetical protein